MKKQSKTLIILAAVLAVLIVGYNIIKAVSGSIEQKKSAEAEAESLANIIYVNSLEEFYSISFEEFTFEYLEADGTWNYSDSEFPLDSSLIETIAAEFLELTASREISDADTMESYGLAEPAYEIVFTDADGNEESFQIGNAVDSEYYVMVNNDDSVIYTCTFTALSYLDYELNDFALIEDISELWSSNPVSYYFTDGTDSVLLENTTEEDTDTEEWNVTKNIDDTFLATDNIDSVESTLGFAYEGLAAYAVSDDELAACGLDSPLFTLVIKYEGDDSECETTVYVGNYDEANDMYYAMSTESDDVFYITADNYELFVDALSYDYLENETTEE